MAQTVKNLSATQETQVHSPGWEDPLEKRMATPPVFLPGESHGQRRACRLQSMGLTESDTTARHIRLSLTSLSLIISRFINDAAIGIISFSFYD